MQVLELNRANSGANIGLLMGMHRLRRKVFKDRLEWAVSVTGDLEMDRFDALDASYLIVKDKNSVLGSVRLLPTTGPNMLADTFPELLDGGSAPNCNSIAESSRFLAAGGRATPAERYTVQPNNSDSDEGCSISSFLFNDQNDKSPGFPRGSCI